MGLKTTVIINGVNNLSDARYCAGMGVDFLGFDLEENSTNYTSHEKYKEIISWINGPETIAEFKNSSVEDILNISSTYSINLVQISNIEIVKNVFKSGKIVLLEVGPENLQQTLFNELKDYVKFFIWTNGDQDPELFKKIRKFASDYPIILGGEFSPSLVEKMNEFPFRGLALRGGNEVKPGYREFDKMADILESLEELD